MLKAALKIGLLSVSVSVGVADEPSFLQPPRANGDGEATVQPGQPELRRPQQQNDERPSPVHPNPEHPNPARQTAERQKNNRPDEIPEGLLGILQSPEGEVRTEQRESSERRQLLRRLEDVESREAQRNRELDHRNAERERWEVARRDRTHVDEREQNSERRGAVAKRDVQAARERLMDLKHELSHLIERRVDAERVEDVRQEVHRAERWLAETTRDVGSVERRAPITRRDPYAEDQQRRSNADRHLHGGHEEHRGHADDLQRRLPPEQREHAERLEHAHLAIEHLRQAGLEDLARETIRRVEELEHHAGEHHPSGPDVMRMIHESHRAIEGVHERLHGLERQLKSLSEQVVRLKRDD